MKDFLKNILLLAIVLLLSYFTAPYFGAWYDKFSPQNSGWLIAKNEAIFFAGIFVSSVFLIPFLFTLFGTKNKNKLISILLIPAVFLWLFSDIYNIYIPILLGLIAFGLATLLQKIFKDSHKIQ